MEPGVLKVGLMLPLIKQIRRLAMLADVFLELTSFLVVEVYKVLQGNVNQTRRLT
jgi:hypothetical protein